MKILEATVFFKQLGERIRKSRKERELTQAQVAEKLGVTQQLIATYETGKRRLPVLTLVKIAEILDISIDDLLRIENKSKADTSLKD